MSKATYDDSFDSLGLIIKKLYIYHCTALQQDCKKLGAPLIRFKSLVVYNVLIAISFKSKF